MSTHCIYELAEETRVLEAPIEVTMARWVPTVKRKQHEIQCKLCITKTSISCMLQNIPPSHINNNTFLPPQHNLIGSVSRILVF
jgi:hypothetical protein